VAVYLKGELLKKTPYDYEYGNVATAQVIVIGAGPAGLFAALRLIELGLKPIVVERGRTYVAVVVT
jgi:ribulose 1,5-bisphosphate synthetase/thiazole synthase